jgi:multidrug resistance protein MdtO
LRALFVLLISTWNYRARLPGFDLPDPIHAAQREFDEEFARTLEGMANRLEGKPAEARDDFNNSFQLLEQSVEGYAATESQKTLAARNRRIRAVTCALLPEI